MADLFDKRRRSQIMQKVKSCGNKSTEIKLIAIFAENGVVGWRRGYPVKGRPDFVFLKKRTAVFVDGCFWHGHDCRNTRPADNKDYWDKKRERNIRRDKETTALFESRRWRVIRIWECELKKKNRDILMKKLAPLLTETPLENQTANSRSLSGRARSKRSETERFKAEKF